MPSYCYEFPRPSLTVDMVCRHRGRLMLIQRGQDPFQFCWALPGGFANEKESARRAGARELTEETGVEVREEDLVEIGAFTEPGRDPRGWVVSVAFMVELTDEQAAQAVAGDDAAAVKFFALDDLPPLAFDHAQIVQRALTMLPAAS